MNALEVTLYNLSKLFLYPVLALIVLTLAFAFGALGAFVVEALQRWSGKHNSRLASRAGQGAASADLELVILKKLEWLRIVSRTTPMLGLVATMIPMGPAMLALSNNDAKGIGDNLAVAFAAVILALVSASITFTILTIRRRWLPEELRAIETAQGKR